MKTITSLITSLLLAVTFISCDSSGSDSLGVDLGESFELKIGEKAQINDDIVKEVTFAEVVEDSRYPSKVICVWEGRAVVKLTLNINEELVDIELTDRAGRPQLAETEIGGRTVRLVSVTPYPEEEAIALEDYVIYLLIE